MPQKSNRPTIRQVAAKSGFAVMTVSQALRNDTRIAQKTREKIKQVAEEMGYKPNPVAQMMAASRGKRRTLGNLACIMGHPDADPIHRNRMYELSFEGIKKRAEHLGYGLDRFWAYDPSIRSERLQGILEARGILGVILFALKRSEIVLSWEQFALSSVAFTWIGQQDRSVDYSFTDGFSATQLVINRLLKKGYNKIAHIAEIHNHRSSMGRMTGACTHFSDKMVSPFYYEKEEVHLEKVPLRFTKWIKRASPDVLMLGNSRDYEVISNWLLQMKINVPEDMGITIIGLAPDKPDLSGAVRQYEVMGAAAVDLVSARLFRSEFGVSQLPYGIYIPPVWCEGKTLLNQ